MSGSKHLRIDINVPTAIVQGSCEQRVLPSGPDHDTFRNSGGHDKHGARVALYIQRVPMDNSGRIRKAPRTDPEYGNNDDGDRGLNSEHAELVVCQNESQDLGHNQP